jgi:hypothetical protein
MLEKICECCSNKFILPKAGKKELRRRFCGPVCSRRWAANNRSDSWRKKASEAKQGENNPMFGVSLNHPNSLANLARGYWKGKTMSESHKQKISKGGTGRIVSEESKRKARATRIMKGQIYPPDSPAYAEFKKYRRKVHYWSEKNDLSVLENYEKRSKTGYSLDHKYSVRVGFDNNVPPKIMGHIYNLHFIPVKENSSKGTKCLITKEMLYELFKNGH